MNSASQARLFSEVRGHIIKLPFITESGLVDEGLGRSSKDRVDEAVFRIKVFSMLFVKDSSKKPPKERLIATQILELRFHNKVLLDPVGAGTFVKYERSDMW